LHAGWLQPKEIGIHVVEKTTVDGFEMPTAHPYGPAVVIFDLPCGVAIKLVTNAYSPQATPLNTPVVETAWAMVFLELPTDWFENCHPTPVRQCLILNGR